LDGALPKAKGTFKLVKLSYYINQIITNPNNFSYLEYYSDASYDE